MKKFAAICGVLLCGHLLTSGASLDLLYPVGGEKLPVNGIHVFTWTNSDNLGFNLYMDWYDTNGNPVLTDMSLYSTTLAAGTNSFTFFMPSNYPGPDMYRYKIRLAGNDGSVVESTSGFVSVTGPASFVGTVSDASRWLPGQNRDVVVSWSGFQSNDTYDVILEAPTVNRSGYGFLMTNVIMGTESGTQTVSIPYPTTQSPAYPPASYAVTNGTHSFSLINRRCGIIQTFGSVDVLTPGVRMYMLPSDSTSIFRGDSTVCSKIMVDATLASSDVSVSKIKLVMTSYSSSQVVLACTLSNAGSVVSATSVSVNPQASQQYDTLVEFPMNLTVCQGEVRELDLVCTVQPESGLGTFIWVTQNGATNVVSGMNATYAGGGNPIVSVVPSFGSYMTIREVVNPKFTYSRLQGSTVSYGVLCKPLTPYLVLASSDLVSWTGFYTTNSIGGTMQIDIPLQVANHFFRVLETNSPPIAMPTGDLLSESMAMMAMRSSVSDEPVVRHATGCFWSLKHPDWPPVPVNSWDLPTVTIDGKIYLDDINTDR